MLDEYVVWDPREYPMLDLDSVYVGRDALYKASRHYWGTWRRLTASMRRNFGMRDRALSLSCANEAAERAAALHSTGRFAQVMDFQPRPGESGRTFSLTRPVALEAVGLSEQDAHADP